MESDQENSPMFTEIEESSDATPVPSSPTEVPDEIKAMDADQRLQRIKYLVDQSKLYAKFLTANLDSESKTEEKKESKPEKAPSDTDTSVSKRSLRSSTVGKQASLKSYFKPAKKEDSMPKPEITEGFQAPKSIQVKMHPHQIIGVEWMVTLFQNGLNGILADEMGLGKTLQVIAFLAYLMEQSITGPFLIVAPLSTLANWKSEFANFCPALEAAQYYGNPSTRTKLRRKLIPKSKPIVPVIITSYEIIMADARFLRNVDWKYIIVDEGHRLKNVNCKLMKELKRYSSANRMLLTGTPLQNNLTELWALLNFLLPDVFTDLEIFHTWFESGEANIDGENESNLVTSLHSILRPFLLRRLKADVHLNLPEKREYVVFTGLTSQQSALYEKILHGEAREYVISKILEERGHELVAEDAPSPQEETRKRRRITYTEHDTDDSESEDESSSQSIVKSEEHSLTDKMVKQAHLELRNKSFANMVMQLRLTCNSPYLFYYPWSTTAVDERIVTSSGKMRLLDQLVKRLHAKKHKVLIFSQFTMMLDLLEDWAILRKYRYSRIDGSTSQEDRQSMLEGFHEESDTDIFLLSTRSGGQGVNLVAADTVILFDSDWNPHQDLQAMDRVHRIGQTKPVLVFRLVTGDTIEQNLLEKAASKLELGNIVIEKGKFRGIGVTQQEQIASMDIQLQEHKMKYDGSVTISDKDFKKMLDRSKQGYENARKNPKLNDNIYIR